MAQVVEHHPEQDVRQDGGRREDVIQEHLVPAGHTQGVVSGHRMPDSTLLTSDGLPHAVYFNRRHLLPSWVSLQHGSADAKQYAVVSMAKHLSS